MSGDRALISLQMSGLKNRLEAPIVIAAVASLSLINLKYIFVTIITILKRIKRSLAENLCQNKLSAANIKPLMNDQKDANE